MIRLSVSYCKVLPSLYINWTTLTGHVHTWIQVKYICYIFSQQCAFLVWLYINFWRIYCQIYTSAKQTEAKVSVAK